MKRLTVRAEGLNLGEDYGCDSVDRSLQPVLANDS